MTQLQQLINTQPTAQLEIEQQQVLEFREVGESGSEKKSYIPREDTPIGKQDKYTEPHREPIKHLLTGSRVAVLRTIHQLQVLGYANAGDWSPLIPNPTNPGEVMSILSRNIIIQ